jgi:hypothetical protein
LSTDHVTDELKLPVPMTVAEHFEVPSTKIEEGEQETPTDVIDGGDCPPPFVAVQVP